VIYADTDMILYFDVAESRAKHVTELSLYTSERVEKKFTEIEAVSDEVASSLLVSKMDLKAVAAKVEWGCSAVLKMHNTGRQKHQMKKL